MNSEKLPITSWSEDDRPREKLIQHGQDTLSNAELLAILIGSGNRHESAVALCQRILRDHENSLDRVSRLSVFELMAYPGIGEAKAVAIISALELGRRRKKIKSQKIKFNSSKTIYEYIRGRLEDKTEEYGWVLYLNRGLTLIGEDQIGMGGRSGVIIDPKVVFKKALDRKASSIILIHNHPSGQ